MRKPIFTGRLVAFAVLLAACGGAGTPADATSSKPVNVKVDSDPNPAMTLAPGASAGVGDIELMLTITDASGNPVEGARVDVSAEHTQMSGMSMGDAATEQGGGKYAINANFSMNGTWMLTVYVRKDGLDYKEEIEFPVQ